MRGALTRGGVVLVAAVVLAGASACETPLGLDLPTTRAIESGAARSLDAGSFEVAGTYSASGVQWSIDLQLVRSGSEHLLVRQGTTQLEAIVNGSHAFFRGADFLSAHLGTGPAALDLINAAGHAWWTGTASDLPNLPDFTTGSRLRSTFLGPVVTRRTDHVSVTGIDAVEMSGPRADVYIAEAAPFHLVRLHLDQGASVDGVSAADLTFSNFGADFGIAAPADVIDFSNLSTLPPLYTVQSVDTSRCGSPCAVSALVKNLGGKSGARAPSTVTFTLVDSASGAVVGSCSTPIQPDVDFNSTATVACTIAGSPGQSFNAATVTASPDNPGRS